MITWTRKGQDSEAEEAEVGLRLLVTKDGEQFDFNGHKFGTEAECKAFVEQYTESAIRRHKLSATNRARSSSS